MSRPADLSAAEIDRRMAVALADIRRGGTGEIARQGEQLVASRLRTNTVLTAIAKQETTIQRLAQVLHRDLDQVWGHVCFLRKMQKVEVKRWVDGPMTCRGRRKMAVYGVKA